jgi:hypothetical protein
MGIDLPQEIEDKIDASEEFSKQIKRKLSSQLPPDRRLNLD